MKRSEWIGVGTGVAWALGSAGAACARINVQTMEPTANSTYTFTEDAFMQRIPRDDQSTAESTHLFLGFQYNVVNDPLVEFDPTRHVRIQTVVDSIQTLDVTAGAFLRPDLELTVNTPLNLVHLTGDPIQFGLGDVRFQAKYQLPKKWDGLAFAIIPEIFAPSGDHSLFLSNESWGFGAKGAFEADFGAIRAAVNLGYRHFGPSATYFDIDYENQLPWSAGVYVPLPGPWGLNVEANGALNVPIDRFNNPGEFYVGGRFQFSKEASFTAGASTASLGAGGSADKRFTIGIKLAPEWPPK